MSQRLARINELLKREISACVERQFEFPDILVTIHDVDTAVDLRTAQVYVGTIGDPEKCRDAVKKLNAKHGMIQGIVMKRVVLRCTPVLHFKVDESIERGVRVLNILDEIGEIELSDLPEGESPLK
ncbi:MAG: 30S ribosome-binding factor RbfA [Verrucomicrobiales bacterium]|jgi:ribosome-binding factor A|nr:30S ribosome-binding factor RbfA [Verrucomicrobiales bacterium]